MKSISLQGIDGTTYAIGRIGRTWVAAIDCDCILGPS